jgi:peptide/nickel transport system substrate-binding protein
VVQFTLDQSNVAFPGTLAGEEGYLAAPAAWAAGAANMTSHPIGSGPFEQLTPGKLTFVRNPSYWRKSNTGQRLPYLDKITYVPLPDSTARIPAVKDNTVDIFQTADTINLVQAHKDPSLIVQPISGSSSTIIVLNSHKPPFNDIRLRQAYNYAMPREAMNTGYYGNSRQPAYGPLDPSNPYFDPKGQLPPEDVAKAKALVAQLRAEGKPTSFHAVCISTPEAGAVYNIINKADLAVGIGSSMQTVDQVVLVNKLLARDGNFENACFRNSQVADPDGLYTTYYRTAGQNVSMTSDLTIDAALRQGRKSTDFATRKAAYDIVQEQLAKDVTVVPMLFDLYGNVHTSGVSGLSRPQPNALGLIDQASLYLTQGG